MRVVIAHSRDLPVSLVRELHGLGLRSVNVSLEEGYPIEARVTRAQANAIEKLDGVTSAERYSTLLSDLTWLVRGSAQILGYATMLSLVIFWFNVWQFERENGRRYAAAPIEVSPVAARLAARFSPQLQTLARDHRAEVIGNVDGMIQKWCVGKVYEPAVEAIPRGTEIASEAALNYLLNVPPREFASDLIEHAKHTGKRVDYRVWQAAEGK